MNATQTTQRTVSTTLYRLKPAFVRSLAGVQNRLARRGVTADQLTMASLGVAGLTAAVLVAGAWVPLLWLLVGPLCLLRMACNAMDGSMARRSGSAGPRGAMLNELTDRAADALTFLALAPAVGWGIAVSAVAAALGVSLVAVTAEAVTGARLGLGPMGKPDRVAVLSLGATAAAIGGSGWLRAASLTIVAGCAVTVARRTAALWRATAPAAPAATTNRAPTVEVTS